MTHLMLASAAFFWGINPMIMKIGLATINPLAYNVVRLLFAFIISLLVIRFGTRSWKRVEKGDRIRFVLLGLGGFLIFQGGYTFGVHLTAAGVSAMILAILPVFVALISIIGRVEKVSLKAALGITVSLIGVGAITFGGMGGGSAEPGGFVSQTGSNHLLGVLLLVIAEFSYGIYTVFVKPLTRKYPVEQIVCIIIGVVLLPFIALTVPFFISEGFFTSGPLRLFTLGEWFSLLYSSAFGILAGNILWSHGVKRIGSTGTSIYINLTPLFGVAAGFLILAERLSPLQLAGGGLILAGVWLVNYRRRRAS
jgi:drug/metabolite transporter (DMT)-like permease